MPLLETKGAASAQGFGLTLGGEEPTYIEDVFSTWLYTGTGASQTHTNNIDLSTKGGLVWLKRRSSTENHYLQDSSSSFANSLSSNTTAAAIVGSGVITSVSTTGFTTSSVSNGTTYASWTFRKQPKFFDVVTYTGNGTTQNIAHNLGSVPGCIIVKCTSAFKDWQVYHRSLANTEYMVLNTTAAKATGTTRWNSTTPTSTQFSVGTSLLTNESGATYVAYLFAHDAGGFGLTGTDNVISCGSYTGNGSTTGPVVTLGYEPQWLLIKRAVGGVDDWVMIDNMRGMVNGDATSNEAILIANGSNAEVPTNRLSPLATGFQLTDSGAAVNASGNTYIYIAIRRGPMKVPTTGTSVFDVETFTGGASTRTLTSGFPPDMTMLEYRSSWNYPIVASRLTGKGKLIANQTDAENTTNTSWIVTDFDSNTGTTKYNDYAGGNLSSRSVSNGFISWMFRRAPGFMDVVCYTGTGAVINQSHNLTVPPELIIFKSRSAATAWRVICNIGVAAYDRLSLNTTAAAASDGYGSAKELVSQPTSTVLSIGTGSTLINSSGATFVAYLFASCPGVSKVGSYTGTGTTQTINCGFTAGSRFVLIKRTDSSGDWYVWDSARGIVAGNDPYLLLNSTAAEVTNTDFIDTASTGFEISSTAPAAINANGGTFIFLAIA
jgi:hypothetical protein